MEAILKLHLTDLRPLLMHNGRLANPLDPHTRAVAAIAKKRNKTDQDYAQLALLEARGGMYETAEGRLGLPTDNVIRCLYDAGKAFKLGEAIKAAVVPTGEVVPLLIDGEPRPCDTWLSGDATALLGERLLYVPVVVNRRRTMRARALVPAGWEADVALTVLADVLHLERLGPVLERAGRLGGLCDWRPRYGTFLARIIGEGSPTKARTRRPA